MLLKKMKEVHQKGDEELKENTREQHLKMLNCKSCIALQSQEIKKVESP